MSAARVSRASASASLTQGMTTKDEQVSRCGQAVRQRLRLSPRPLAGGEKRRWGRNESQWASSPRLGNPRGSRCARLCRGRLANYRLPAPVTGCPLEGAARCVPGASAFKITAREGRRNRGSLKCAPSPWGRIRRTMCVIGGGSPLTSSGSPSSGLTFLNSPDRREPRSPSSESKVRRDSPRKFPHFYEERILSKVSLRSNSLSN